MTERYPMLPPAADASPYPSHQIGRRALCGGLVAAALLPSPAAAGAPDGRPCEPDPVYAAIEAYRQAEADFDQVTSSYRTVGLKSDTMSDLNVSATHMKRRAVRSVIPNSASTADAEASLVDRLCTNAERWDAQDAFHDSTFWPSLINLISTPPTTLTGMAALLAFVREAGGVLDFIGDNAEHIAMFERAIECSICALAGLPTPALSAHLVGGQHAAS